MHNFIKRNAKNLLCAAAFVAAGVFYVLQSSGRENSSEIVISNTQAVQQSMSYETKILVYVCGQVLKPGVYELEQGSRVNDAIGAAGGITESAAVDNLNLAETVSDGQRIYVPGADEITESGDFRVNINTATRQELMTLPGIGQSKADDIISYRSNNGSFRCVEDIMEVPGIKEAAFLKLKDYITVT